MQWSRNMVHSHFTQCLRAHDCIKRLSQHPWYAAFGWESRVLITRSPLLAHVWSGPKCENCGRPIDSPVTNLEPLHTWAKSHDHEIVRAQEKLSKGRPKTSPTVVWSHMWLDPQPNAILMNFCSWGSSTMIKYNKPTVMSVWSAMVSWFCVRSTSKRWFLKTIHITMKHDPFDAI